MNKCIDDAEVADGGEGFVTLASLRQQLNTPVWKDLDNADSTLGKILLSQYFKDEKKGHDANQISVEFLKMYALMHCVGTNMDKASAFYLILQEGGFERHDQISAGDKDFEPAFKKMCTLASTELFELAGGLGVSCPYDDDELENLVSDDTVEELREAKWLEEVYGATSRLENDQWLAKVSKTANWIFNPQACRAKLFEQANV